MIEKDIEVLVTTMDLDCPEELIRRMNIRSDFLVGNQTTRDNLEKCVVDGNTGYIYSRNERWVGKNRNTILSNASAKFCVFADDDMVFKDNYVEIILDTFGKYPEADVIVFNLSTYDDIAAYDGERRNKKAVKVNYLNYMNYGAARLVFRRKVVSYSGILFNLNFGGGTPHQCGEDTLFIKDCLQAGLKIFAVPESIAYLTHDRDSTWFEGYNKKYFFDKGVFLATNSPKLSYFIGLLLVLKHKEYYSGDMSFREVFSEIKQGIEYIKETLYENRNDEKKNKY